MRGRARQWGIGCVVVALAAAIGCGAPARRGPDLAAASAAPNGTVPPHARRALAEVERALAVSRRYGALIWPGFRLDARPLLLFDGAGDAWLVGAPRAPHGGHPIALPGSQLGTVWRLRIPPSDLSGRLPFVQELRVDGMTAFAIRYGRERSWAAWYRLLVHEVFHVHQRAAWGGIARPERGCRYPLDDVDHLAWAEVEQRALAAALAVRERPGERRDALVDLAVLRATRRATAGGAEAAELERHEERIEGTARYVELRYAMAAGRQPREATLAEVRDRLGALRLMDVTKWRYYHTGAALGLLLDRMPEEGAGRWTRAVDAGAALEDVLFDRVAADGAAARRDRLATLHRRPAIRARIGRAVARQRRAEDRWRERFERGDGRPVTIHFVGSADGYYENRGPTITLPDCSRLVTGIRAYVSTRYGVEIRGVRRPGGGTRGRPVVLYSDAARQRVSFRSGAPDVLRADGAAAPSAGRWARDFREELVVEHPEWHVRFRGRGRVERDGAGALVLRLGE